VFFKLKYPHKEKIISYCGIIKKYVDIRRIMIYNATFLSPHVPFPKSNSVIDPTFGGSYNPKTETMRGIGEYMIFNRNSGGFHGIYIKR